MYYNEAQLAELLARALGRYEELLADNDNPLRRCDANSAGQAMLAIILQEVGLPLINTTSVRNAIDELRSRCRPYDLLNPADRQFMSFVLFQMYEPLGVSHIIEACTTPEGRHFVSVIDRVGSASLNKVQVKHILSSIVEETGDDDEWEFFG